MTLTRVQFSGLDQKPVSAYPTVVKKTELPVLFSWVCGILSDRLELLYQGLMGSLAVCIPSSKF
ncbi:MAG: hypothetical protein WBG66_22195 [Geitlerinemataceae cyanobacterium]